MSDRSRFIKKGTKPIDFLTFLCSQDFIKNDGIEMEDILMQHENIKNQLVL